MSWLSELAKKGEQFLENVDQTAAKTVQIVKKNDINGG